MSNINKKKKILFVIPSFNIGGTTVSTRHLISVLDANKYDISVLALNTNGILRWMYSDVPQLRNCFAIQALALDGWRMEKNWLRRFTAAIIRMAAKKSPKAHKLIIRKSIYKCLGENEFDTVVACQEGITSYFVSNISCRHLVAWVRCDYKYYYETNGRIKECFYTNFNRIVCVSEQTKKHFAEIYPYLKERTVCIHNPQDSKLIISQSNKDDGDSRFELNRNIIVSVGRLSPEKRFIEIPKIAHKLKSDGICFKWYIIGDGVEKNIINKAIEEYNVGDEVLMLGAKSNPHFYLKKADLYVCISSSEACPRVINEAKILGTPVVSTDFPSVYEYLEDGVNGRVTSLGNIINAIREMLTDRNQYDSIKKEIAGFKFDNTQLIIQLDSVL